MKREREIKGRHRREQTKERSDMGRGRDRMRSDRTNRARRARSSRLLELGKNGVNVVERRVDLAADLGSCEDDLAADEDEQDDLGLDHAVDEAGEELSEEREEASVQSSLR